MPTVGDTKTQFNRTYIWLEPNVSAPGSWRLTGNDNTPGASQTQTALQATGNVDSGTPTITLNQLVYVTATGTIALADASSINTAKVAGVAVATATSGNPVTYTRNQPITITNVATVVDSAPTTLESGKYYYLSSTNPGNFTRTPDTTTSGSVIVQVGLALGSADMAIEIQSEVLI